MKFMIALLMAVLPAASVAQSQPEAGPGVPSGAIPKTTAVLVIQTPKQGVTVQQVMAVIPDRDSGDCEALSRRENSRVVFARRWQRRHLPGGREDRGRGTGPYGNAAARERTFDGSRVHSRRTVDAAKGNAEPRSAFQ